MTSPPGPLFLVQFYLDCLSHASYLIGDRTTGRAVVVDPQRDVNQYVDTAEFYGLTIERIIETHVHADFLSGHLELAKRTGACISYGSADAVGFDSVALADGEHLLLGEVDLEVLHTPGHTPESICLVVREHAGDAVPHGVLTGDTLFVGDVGRPDLLSDHGVSAESMARALYRSIHERLLALPDETRVYPAHGAGSACGKHLSTELSCTIGRQRRVNAALTVSTEDEFVSLVTHEQALEPPYFAFTSARNRQERPVLDEEGPVTELTPEDFLRARDRGATVLDTRDPESFNQAHLVGAVNVPLAGRFAETAGAVLGATERVVLCGTRASALEARNRLARIGFDQVLGALDRDVVALTQECLVSVERVEIATLAARLSESPEEVELLDVRGPAEARDNGTIPGARLLPLPRLVAHLNELTTERQLTVLCASGNRSSVAASLLRARGFDAVDLRGGYTAWRDRLRVLGSAARGHFTE